MKLIGKICSNTSALIETSKHRRRRWASKLTVGAMLLCGVVALAGREHTPVDPRSERFKGPSLAESAAPPAPVAFQAGATYERVQGEVVRLRRTGFEPREITRAAGRFVLFVDNRSGLDEMDLQLSRLTGERVHDVQVPREKLDWDELFDLTPGTYLLTEANHPGWVCRITVKGR
jgi:hypothetical protein